MPAHGQLWAMAGNVGNHELVHIDDIDFRMGAADDRRGTLVHKGAGPSPGAPIALGRGSAIKRQSQTKKRPKLEFRGP